MLLKDDKIYLRALEPEDLDYLYKLENDSSLWRYGNTLSPYSRFVLRAYLEDSLTQNIFQLGQLRLMICCVETDEVIGTIDLYDINSKCRKAGVGVFVEESHRGQGIAKRSLLLMREYGFKFLNLSQLYAKIVSDNTESIQLFSTKGYKQTGVLEKWHFENGVFKDVVLMQLFAE